MLNPRRWANAPKDGIVAVKVQYPDALQVMIQDLSNIRVAAKFLEVRVMRRGPDVPMLLLDLCNLFPVQGEGWKPMGYIDRGGLVQGEQKFDLVSPVDELAKQVRMEFDFKHEALVMNEVGKSLQVWHDTCPKVLHSVSCIWQPTIA